MGGSAKPRQRWLWRAATGSLAVVIAFAALLAPRFALPVARAAGTTVTVDSYGDWVDTGVSVTPGEMLSISANGSWTPGAPSDQYYGPDGSSTPYPDNYLNLNDIGCGDPSCASTPAPHWAALIGYIGDNPPYPGSYSEGGVQADAQRVFFVGSK
ncbi:MAG TPA: hypothetical protein VFA78_02335, partial [Chloroflexota bacterium]|nr:hypothetical protein [Chloroflexota bacterium]